MSRLFHANKTMRTVKVLRHLAIQSHSSAMESPLLIHQQLL